MSSIEEIIKRFQSNGILINQDWLKLNKHISNYDVLYKIFLISDLKLTTIPAGGSVGSKELMGVKRTVLFPKGAVLQLIDIVDSGKSLIHQVEQLKGIEEDLELEELELKSNQPKVKTHCFKLTMSDGQNEFQASEKVMINDLKMDMPLGSKIYVKAVTAMRGLMMLEPTNCRELGGKIETLNNLTVVQRLEKKLRGADYVESTSVATQTTGQLIPSSNVDTASIVTTQIQPNSSELPASTNTVTPSNVITLDSADDDIFDDIDDSFINLVASEFEEEIPGPKKN